MFRAHWSDDFVRLTCYTLILVKVATQPVRRPPPTFEIVKKGNNLYFNASPPGSNSNQCWHYLFEYRKCNEKPDTIKVTEEDNWIAEVEYDIACKYTVQLKAKYDTTNCGKGEHDSDMSKPVYFGQNRNPNLLFIVAMISIPVIVCSCLVMAVVLFRRHKENVFPEIPSPSHFFKDMFDTEKEIPKGLYATELYVPNREVVDELHVELNTTLASEKLISKTT